VSGPDADNQVNPFPSGLLPGVELLDEIGRGALSVVFRVRRDDGEYAVKILQQAGDERAALDFRREAALLAGIVHPGLAQIHEVGEAAGRPYLIMDLIEGTSLAELVTEGPLAELRVAQLGVQVAAALAVAHRVGLVHRDVKPENVMVRSDGTAVLIDFGLAMRASTTITDTVAGTFIYSAPEQAGMLRRAVDRRADLYALGVVLFECLTGEPPFRADDVGELVRLHLSTPAPDLRARRTDTSPAMAAIVARLLAKDPDDRYASADALRADLSKILAGQWEEFPLGGGDDSGFTLESELVGRDGQYQSLAARWHSALAGHGGVVLIQGAPGCGKSRLARELSRAVAAGHLVLHGTCVRDDGIPLGPLREAIDTYLRNADEMAPVRLREIAGDTAGLLAAVSGHLAELLGVPAVDADGDNQYRFAEAVAALLVGVASAEGGAVLYLDDVQWCDEATRRVLSRLAHLLADSPLLVVVTSRDDPASSAGLSSFRSDLKGAIDFAITLDPLDDAAIADLVTSQLGARSVPPGLIALVIARGGGSPFVVLEYIRAFVDAGLIRPSWRDWVFDAAGLDALTLSEDVVTMVLSRLDGLSTDTRRLLEVAAVVGARFSADVVAAVAGLDHTAVGEALAEAATGRLVEKAEPTGYAFLHDRIREALLTERDADTQRWLHQRIADELVSRPGAAEQVYAVAHHYLNGQTKYAPDKTFCAAVAAGTLALAQHAPSDALDLLTRAAEVAEAADISTDAAFHTEWGIAASRAGRYALAEDQLSKALTLESDAFRRGSLYATLAQICYYRWEGDRALEMVRSGMADLGRSLPRNPLRLRLSAVMLFVAGLFIGLLPRPWRVARHHQERHRLHTRLNHIGVWSAVMSMRQSLLPFLILRGLYDANRLGPGPDSALAMSDLAIAAKRTRQRWLAHRMINGAVAAVGATDLYLQGHLHLTFRTSRG
jgi:tRNA A-37 threonylcarbamoyl transferase component Bud32